MKRPTYSEIHDFLTVHSESCTTLDKGVDGREWVIDGELVPEEEALKLAEVCLIADIPLKNAGLIDAFLNIARRVADLEEK